MEFGDLKYINIAFQCPQYFHNLFLSFNSLIHTARNDPWFIHVYDKVIYFPTPNYSLLLVEYRVISLKHYNVLYK